MVDRLKGQRMAKRGTGLAGKKRGGKSGSGTIDEQIAALESAVKPKGVKAANEILETYDGDIIRLAFKYHRKRALAAGPGGLGSRIEALLGTMSNKEAAEMREKLLEAKRAKAEV